MTRPIPILLVALIGCTGTIDDVPSLDSLEPPPDSTSARFAVSTGEVRRLRASEMDRTLEALFDDRTTPAARLLGDSSSVFDESYEAQVASGALIEAVELLALEVSARAVETEAKRDALVGCDPAQIACLDRFIARIGRRVLRRPLVDEEREEYTGLFASIASHALGSTRDGLATVLSAMLQHPEFVYHVEAGSDALAPTGTRALTSFELASRMSFFLWGEAPNEALLDAAANGLLADRETRRDIALEMLQDDRARRRVEDFHAGWLGYDLIPHSADIAAAMRRESDALVSRVVFDEERSWLDLFRLPETYIDSRLAELYGLSPIEGDEPMWIDVSGTDRGSLLAHGSYLSQGSKFGDTSPVQRGLIVTTRLRCSVVPEPPPDVMVDVDNPPDGDACKIENYEAHSRGACAGCHASLDGTGMGLESYDGFGSYRLAEPDRPECSLESDGVLANLGGTEERSSFRGPRELGEQLIQAGELDACAVTQLYRFAMGRHEVESEVRALGEWTDAFRRGGHRLDLLMAEIVASETFGVRKAEEE